MSERPAFDRSEEELRREFFTAGGEFFSWHSGKHVPSILVGLSERVETLQIRAKEATDIIASLADTVQEAGIASENLASALNKFTLALAIIGAIGLVVQTTYVAFTIWAYFHK